MREGELARVAVVLALVGIACVFLLAKSIEPKSTSVERLGEAELGGYYETSGFVSKHAVKNGNVFFSLCEKSECVKVFIAKAAAQAMEANPYILENGKKVVVRGVLQEYEGERELVVSSPKGVELGG